MPMHPSALLSGFHAMIGQVGRREKAKGGTRRRMGMAFRWVCLEWPWGLVRMRRARFSGSRALGGGAAARLQCGSVAWRAVRSPAQWQRPRVWSADLRRTAALHHQAELGRRCRRG